MQAGLAWSDFYLWDARPAYYGYYDRVARTGVAPQGKSFNATVDALTTHALQLYLLRPSDEGRDRLEAKAGVLERRRQHQEMRHEERHHERGDEKQGTPGREHARPGAAVSAR